MAKEKKVETRDIVYEQLAAAILAQSDEETVSRYKEGLRIDIDDVAHIVRVVKKKEEPKQEELLGGYAVAEDGKLTYTLYKEIKG